LVVLEKRSHQGQVETAAAAHVFQIARTVDGNHAKARFREQQFTRAPQAFRGRDDQNLFRDWGQDVTGTCTLGCRDYMSVHNPGVMKNF
jgi:hypothetical protein